MNLFILFAEGGNGTTNQLGTWYWMILAIGIGFLVMLLLSKRNRWDKDRLAYLDTQEFLDTMRKGSLVDTRKEEDIEKTGKIVGSRNFPGASGARDAKVRKDLPIFLYDQAGSNRLKGIAAKYIKNGAVMVYVLKGGYEEYKAYIERRNK